MAAAVSSSTSTSTAASASSSSTSCASTPFSTFPTSDVGCAVGSTTGVSSNTTDQMKSCCKTAPVTSWANGCAYYCLAIDQSVGDLLSCFQGEGIEAGDIFCNGNNTASATATGAPSSTGGSTGGAGTQTGTGATAGATSGAAVALGPVQGVSKAGLGMLAMLVVSAAAGALL